MSQYIGVKMESNYIYYRVWAEVDLDSIKENVLNIQKGLKEGVKTCAVIKADGYGHGAIPIAKKLKDTVDFFAVATFDEATNLRNHDIEKPILVLGYVHTDNTQYAVRSNIRFTVFDLDMAQKIDEFARDIDGVCKVHIKVDTGMSRIGFAPTEESLETIEKIAQMPNVEIEGIFTHFFASDSADLTSAYRQFDTFKTFCDKLEERGVHIPVKHCSNSAAATVMPEANMDMVRLGISMYGLYPSEDVHQIELKPALSLHSHVVMVKTIEEGTTVGYGATFTASRPTKIATIPVGYADGYFRRLSNVGYVLINGCKAPIAGRVCMDQFMVDVTDIPDVKRGDRVTLIGQDGENCITMEEISELAGSFNYEFACDIGKRVPRVFYSDGEEVCDKDYFYDRYMAINKNRYKIHCY